MRHKQATIEHRTPEQIRDTSVPHGSGNVAYSNQLMQHLQPDDALEQLQNIYDALGARGIYGRFPVPALILCEWLSRTLPRDVRSAIVHSPFRVFLEVRLVGIK